VTAGPTYFVTRRNVLMGDFIFSANGVSAAAYLLLTARDEGQRERGAEDGAGDGDDARKLGLQTADLDRVVAVGAGVLRDGGVAQHHPCNAEGLKAGGAGCVVDVGEAGLCGDALLPGWG